MNAISTIENLKSVEDPEELQRLEEALTTLSSSSLDNRGRETLFRVFERFPDKDGYGIFWSILHELEKSTGYETQLIESVRRQPSEFGLRMVNRILNGGVTRVGGKGLLLLLEEVAADERQPVSIREEAQGYLKWQRRLI